ncbi:hypothetical protein MAR_029727, partial [Mya arenaria]
FIERIPGRYWTVWCYWRGLPCISHIFLRLEHDEDFMLICDLTAKLYGKLLTDVSDNLRAGFIMYASYVYNDSLITLNNYSSETFIPTLKDLSRPNDLTLAVDMATKIKNWGAFVMAIGMKVTDLVNFNFLNQLASSGMMFEQDDINNINDEFLYDVSKALC